MATFDAHHRHARISPRKVRPLADLVRGKLADEALEILKYQPQRGARLLEKVIQSAIGNAADPNNAKANGRALDSSRLYVSDVSIDGASMFKRIRPRARGMAFSIKKRLSHINVRLTALDGYRSR